MTPRMLQRYSDSDRLNHWALVILFFCAALSGLSMYHPSLFFLTNLFGGGPWTRILHPFLGVLVALSFAGMFLRLWRDNAWKPGDGGWISRSGRFLAGHTEEMPPADRYNPAQKLIFWWMVVCLLLLLLSGVVFWRPYFAASFPIDLVRAATLLHSLLAVLLVIGVVIHVYAAIWVKGTTRAMTRGTVPEGWARRHHPLWFERVTRGKP